MKNYKIKVNSKDESKEVQELFESLGYEKGACSLGNYPAVIVTTQDWATGGYCSTRALGLDITAHDNYTEITLAELRDLVVLKRNDVNDATHINTVTDSKVLQQGNKNYYWYSGEWHLYPCGVDIRPIEKTMKEYLVKTKDGEYHYINDSYDTCPAYVDKIEIPEGAEIAIKFKYDPDDFGIIFYKNNGKSCFSQNDKAWQHDADWTMKDLLNEDYCEDGIDLSHDVLWQREQDEPFLTPECTLNDQYAEIEQVIQHSHYKKDVSNLEFIDVYRVLKLFDVTDPCLQHAIKKLLCSGQRGAKSSDQDVQEAIDSLVRFQQMRIEDSLD